MWAGAECDCRNCGPEQSRPLLCIQQAAKSKKYRANSKMMTMRNETEIERRERLIPYTTFLKEYQNTGIHNKWLENTDIRHAVRNAKDRSVHGLHFMKSDEDAKADRLSSVLQSEQTECFQEIKDKLDSGTATKVAQMREYVKTLRKEREEYEANFVAKKKEQLYRIRSEPLRSLLSDKHQKMIAQDWNEQKKFNNKITAEDNTHIDMWNRVTMLDVQEQGKREVAEERIRAEIFQLGVQQTEKYRHQRMLSELASKKFARDHENAVIEEIQKELALQNEQKKIEMETRGERNRAFVKEMAAMSEYYKNRKLKKEAIVEQELLKKAIREKHWEEENLRARAIENARAISVYTAYLNKRDCYENARELENDKLLDSYLIEQDKKKYAVRANEQRQIRVLRQNVADGLKHQTEDLKLRKAANAIEEKEHLKLEEKHFAEFDAMQQQLTQETVDKNLEYQRHLECQLDYINQLKKNAMDEEQRQVELNRMEKDMYEDNLIRKLESAHVAISNPHRVNLPPEPTERFCPVPPKKCN